jgi:hypothetical protein
MTAFITAPRARLAGAALLLLAVSASLSGCSNGPKDTGTHLTSSPSSTRPARSAAPSAGTDIVLELDGHSIQGHLTDSPTARSLARQLPLTLTFRDYRGQEKIASVPQRLDLKGAPEGSAAPALTIGYYAPNRSIVLYYDNVDYSTGIVPIGTYENAVGTRAQPDTFPMTIRVAE